MDEPLRDLVVDDDSSIRNIVQEALSDGGFEPKAASSGEEAIALLNVHSYRVVIIDIVSGKDQVKGWPLPGVPGHSYALCSPLLYDHNGKLPRSRISYLARSGGLLCQFAIMSKGHAYFSRLQLNHGASPNRLNPNPDLSVPMPLGANHPSGSNGTGGAAPA